MSWIKLGGFRIAALSDGFFRLDGGSMFGVIPKSLWERHKPADFRNRIRLGLNCLLVDTGRERILIEAGLGDKLDAREEDLYGREGDVRLPERLEELGLRPDDLDAVILSHLHLDHCGWATREGEGGWVPTFPRARYLVQEREWRAALAPDRRSRASYDPRDFLALEQAGLLDPVSGEREVFPGVRVRLTGGHTPGHQVVEVESERQRCVFLGDLVPTFAHLRITWHMGWDLFPLDLMRVKGEILEEAKKDGHLLFFPHEDSMPFARLDDEGRPGSPWS